MKKFLNIIKYILTYIVLPFVISTFMMVFIDIINISLSHSLPYAQITTQAKSYNIINAILKLKFVDLVMLINGTIVVIKLIFKQERLKNIKLKDILYITNNKDYKTSLNSFCFCHLRIEKQLVF